MQLLVADDSRSARLILTHILTSTGLEIVPASDGLEALDVLKRPDAPRIALLDWQMPKLDGIDVCRRVRDSAKNSLPYIIMITAKAESDALVRAFEAGVDDYVNKPYNTDELISRVRAGVRIVQLHQENEAYMHRLQHQKKMASISQLAAGLAHEINTPAQYIGDNAKFLLESQKDIQSLLELYAEMTQLPFTDEAAIELVKKVAAKKEEIDYSFLSEEIPSAIFQCIHGIKVITRIVGTLKEFSRTGGGHGESLDIHRILKVAITASESAWNHVATLTSDFDHSLPSITVIPEEIEQAFVNLLVNAGQAINEKKQKDPNAKGAIRVSTQLEDERVVVAISDSGVGISKDIQERIFDPFFTTKEVGEGMGQGLTIAYDIVVKRHNGTLSFVTGEDGTVFRISLPLDENAKASDLRKVNPDCIASWTEEHR